MLAATTTNRRPAPVTDRSYYLGLARAHHALGNRSGRSWAIEKARRAPVRPSLMAARLAWTERTILPATATDAEIERALVAHCVDFFGDLFGGSDALSFAHRYYGASRDDMRLAARAIGLLERAA